MTSNTLTSAQRRVEIDGPLDLRATLAPMRHGGGDLTMQRFGASTWRATRTPEGPATACYTADPANGCVDVEAWGPGAAWIVEHTNALVGGDDDRLAFDAMAKGHPTVAELHHRMPGLRLPRSFAVVEAMVPFVLEQKVTGFEAKRSWRHIVKRWGEPAPGPAGAATAVMLPPPPEVLAHVPYHELHPLGVERKRADIIRRVGKHAMRLEEASAMTPIDAMARLLAVNGIGAWTAASVALVAFGDPDAVPVGDYHLPKQVCLALTGNAAGGDARMLELLEPFAGQRGRVCRLVEAAGVMPERRAPRRPINGLHRR